MTFYDNHDMARIDADEAGFIDANNWLFTARGIPVVYYGSEIGFRAGTDQHAGNRDYFGQENIEIARSHPIRKSLSQIATVRKNSVALQRGLQLNIELSEDTAVFFRVYQHDGVNQTALVMLNKSDAEVTMDASAWLFDADWNDAASGEALVDSGVSVAAHGVRILLTESVFANPDHGRELADLQLTARRN
jgi:cyclomaltodextrin glucanotransferase